MSGTGPDTPTVPDEAVGYFLAVLHGAGVFDMHKDVVRAGLTAAASHIVAANRAEPDSDLEALRRPLMYALIDRAKLYGYYIHNSDDADDIAGTLMRVVQAYVDGQVAAARADERAKLRAALEATEAEEGRDFDTLRTALNVEGGAPRG